MLRNYQLSTVFIYKYHIKVSYKQWLDSVDWFGLSCVLRPRQHSIGGVVLLEYQMKTRHNL